MSATTALPPVVFVKVVAPLMLGVGDERVLHSSPVISPEVLEDSTWGTTCSVHLASVISQEADKSPLI